MTETIIESLQKLQIGESFPLRFPTKDIAVAPTFLVFSRTGQTYDGVEFYHVTIMKHETIVLNFFSQLSIHDNQHDKEQWLNKISLFVFNYDLSKAPVQNQCIEWFAHFSDPMASLIRRLTKALDSNLFI